MTHQHNCIDDILDRITQLEKRLDEMERNFNEHATDYNIHVKHKTYRPPSRNSRTSPPPPPPQGSDDHGFIIYKPRPSRRQTSAPGRLQSPVNVKGHVPTPPPLPDKLKL